MLSFLCTGPATPSADSEPSSVVQAVRDIDIADEDNPLSCTVYVAEIMQHIFAAEVSLHMLSQGFCAWYALLRNTGYQGDLTKSAMQRCRRPMTSYMATIQTDINEMMRSILVDWLIEVAQVSIVA